MKKKWFETWFNSHYYHVLYAERDELEASRFIDNLLTHLELPQNARLLDLACGKGRHAAEMVKHGYRVTGLDLSPNNIRLAREKHADVPNLFFSEADMRCLTCTENFDAIFNLFTSFGYFDSLEDNVRVLHSIHENLKDGGLLIIDFMNSKKVAANLIGSESKTVEGIHFDIQRELRDGIIKKRITVNNSESYCEEVQYIERSMFDTLLAQTGFQVRSEFGSYDLEPFDIEDSDRLILICQRYAK